MKPARLIRTTILVLLLAIILPAPVLAENPPAGAPADAPPGQANLIKEWETPVLDGELVTFDGRGDLDVVRPGWAVYWTKSTETGASKRFHLVHFGPKGEITRSVVLGDGVSIRSSRDGHRFAITKILRAEGFKPGEDRRDVTAIVDDEGHVRHTINGFVYVAYLGPGGSLLVTVGGRKGLLEVYDSQFKLIGSYGKPEGFGDETFPMITTAEDDGIVAIALTQLYQEGLWVLDGRGKLLFRKDDINPGKYDLPTLGISKRHGLIALSGTEKVDGALRRYITLYRTDGTELWKHVFLNMPVASFHPNFQFSENGKYLRAWDHDDTVLLDDSGMNIYRLNTSVGSQEKGTGLLTDEGYFIGILASQQNVAVVKPDGDIIDTGIPRPENLYPYRYATRVDARRGLLLSFSYDKTLVGWKIPPELLSEIHRIGGVR